MSRLPRWSALSVMGLALCTCQPSDPTKPPPAKYFLEGSLSQLMDLGYDKVTVDGTSQDIAVTFVRVRPLTASGPDAGQVATGTSEDYPFKLTYRYEGTDAGVPVNVRADLVELDANGGQRGTASRNVLNDPRKTFPPLVRGTVFFDGFPTPNTTLRGDFHITFENGLELASGRTVFGTFEAQVNP